MAIQIHTLILRPKQMRLLAMRTRARATAGHKEIRANW
jgi:hypothetical protein